VTGKELRRIRTALGMSDADLARLFSVNRSTVHRWEMSGVGRQSGMIAIALDLLQHFVSCRICELGEGTHDENFPCAVLAFGRELREAAKVDPLHALAMLFSPWANPDLYGRRGGWVAEWIRKKGT
jgi:transcriptional regulator with XRE-family HTH domain